MKVEWFWQRGGARIQFWYVTPPFARIGVAKDGIRLQGYWKRYELRADEVREISVVRGLTMMGVSIVHSSTNVPQDLIFWTFSLQNLLRALIRAGFDLQD